MSTAYNETAGTFVATRVQLADSFVARGRGLIGRKNFHMGDALWIRPCNSIHCFFMAYPIDVIYLDQENRIIDMDIQLRPWRIARPRLRAHSVLELPAGAIALTGAKVGDKLRFSSGRPR